MNDQGHIHMVDVGEKSVTTRTARARARIALPPEVAAWLSNDELHSPKGPVFQTARIAGIQAAKRTSELIPLCHPIALEHCEVTVRMEGPQEAVLECSVRTSHKTGVEMEALTGATIAALTVYDMCKSLSQDIRITGIRLLAKTGGKHDVDRDD